MIRKCCIRELKRRLSLEKKIIKVLRYVGKNIMIYMVMKIENYKNSRLLVRVILRCLIESSEENSNLVE